MRANRHSGPHGANSQLCGATYIELSQLSGNQSQVADVEHVLSAEIHDASASVSDWSWVDTLFMSMNVYSRMGDSTTQTICQWLCSNLWIGLFL